MNTYLIHLAYSLSKMARSACRIKLNTSTTVLAIQLSEELAYKNNYMKF